MEPKTKELGLKALLEKGEVEKFFDVQMKEKDNEVKGQLIGSIARIADMVTQHSEGIFVDEITERLTKSLMGATNEISEALTRDLEGTEQMLRNLVAEKDADARADILQELSQRFETAERNLTATMQSQLDAALPELAEAARLTEDEKQELIDNTSLSVESQMSELIGAYFADNALTTDEIQGFRETVQSMIDNKQFDFSQLTVDFEKLTNLPTALDRFLKTGGKFRVRSMIDVKDWDDFSNGQALVFDSTDKKLKPGNPTAASPLTTKGDLFVRGTGGDNRLPVGTNDQVLIADSTQTYGVKWGTVSATVSTLNDIGNVTITSIASGEILKWNGSAWINNTLAEAGIAAASHTHTASDITDFDTEVANNAAVAANTAKVTNATHTGDVTGSTALTIADEAVTLAKMAHIATNRMLGRATAGTGDVEALTATQARDNMNVGTGDSPQFAGVNVGHATDTTITRVSAGVIAVEGTNVQLEPSEGGFADGDKTKLDAITGTNTGDEPSASTTVEGVVELATTAETDTGTDTGRAVTPDGLAGSYAGTKSVVVQAEAMATDLAVGDDLATFYIPGSVGGMNLVGVHAYVDTAGTTGTTDIQIHNETQAADMLTTKITIDSTETSSRTAATAPVIDTANDDVAAGDKIRIDVDAVSTTAPKGLFVELEFRLP